MGADVKAWIQSIDRRVFGSLYSAFQSQLEREILGCGGTVLDVGCGSNSPLAPFSRRIPYTVGIDGFQPALEASKQRGIHDDYIQASILELDDLLRPRSFDCVVALDVIEHVEKEDGYRLLQSLERIAVKKVIVFTPNGFLPQGDYDGNRYQVHVSGWTVGEMTSAGYRVTGVNGWKPLRGEMARVKWRPTSFWTRVAHLTQLATTTRPEWAFQLLCVKDV